MSSLSRGCFRQTFEAIDQFLCESNSNQLINENLELVEKSDFDWIWLCLLAPFYRFFGKDSYSHVRVYRVADRVFDLCEKNREEIDSWLIKNVKERILDSLNKRTKGKYKKYFDHVAAKLDALIPMVQPSLEEIQGFLGQQTLDSDHLKRINSALVKVFPYFKEAPENYFLKFEKKGRKIRVQRSLILEKKFYPSRWGKGSFKEEMRVSVPLSFYIEMRGSWLHDIILLAKRIIGQGGQTKVRECFGLLTKRVFARKKISPNDRQALQPFLEKNLFNSNVRGLVPIPIWRQRNLEKLSVPLQGEEGLFDLANESGIQLFELKSEETLVRALEIYQHLCSQSSVKKNLIEDLLSGISFLHQQRHPGFIVELWKRSVAGQLNLPLFLWGSKLGFSVPSFQLAHGDLKPRNILIDLVDGNLRALITDFGSLSPAQISYSLAFSSPEKIACFVEKGSSTAFCQKYGQASDVWAMGLICVLILNGKSDIKGIVYGSEFQSKVISYPTPFPLIFEIWCTLVEPLIKQGQLKSDDWHQSLNIEHQIFSQITQETINKDLAKFESQSDPELKPLWDLVKQMLQLNPTNRITAAKALEELQRHSR